MSVSNNNKRKPTQQLSGIADVVKKVHALQAQLKKAPVPSAAAASVSALQYSYAHLRNKSTGNGVAPTAPNPAALKNNLALITSAGGNGISKTNSIAGSAASKTTTAPNAASSSSSLNVSKSLSSALILNKEKQLNPKINASQLLHQLPLQKHLKEVLGTDITALERYALKKKLYNRKLRELVKTGQVSLKRDKNAVIDKEPVVDEKEREIKMDEQGRLRDKDNRIVKMELKQSWTARSSRPRDKFQELIKLAAQAGRKSNIIFDGSLASSSGRGSRQKRRMHALHFIQKSSYISKAERALLNKNKAEAGDESQQKQQQAGMEIEDGVAYDNSLLLLEGEQGAGGASAQYQAAAAARRVTLKVRHHDPIPHVEWWDAPLLEEGFGYLHQELKNVDKANVETEELHRAQLEEIEFADFDDSFFKATELNSLVEHPLPFKNVNLTQHEGRSVVLPVYLTRDEKRKMRRKRRFDKLKDLQEKIKAGLVEPPPPKVKLSNMMNVYQNEAVTDPSKVEQEVKRQIQARLQKHLETNEKRKLTKEQRAEKSVKKWKKDTQHECRVAVFRIETLKHGQQRYKVDINAQEYHLHGVCLVGDEDFDIPAIVIVEGGPKAIKQFKKLLLKRIKWTQGAYNDTEEQKKIDLSGNSCALVWEGIIKEHNFKQWAVKEIKNEMEGKRILAERQVEYLWDMVLNFKLNQAD